jgi:PncC family amidohydrolase
MEKNIATELIDELRQRRLTVGTAESCTAGMIAAMIADVPGASDVLLGGIISYANEVKEEVLDVPLDVIETVGAVSEKCAYYMASGALKKLHCDIAVSVTGIAGPGGGTPEKPVGTVCFGVADDKGVYTETMHFCSEKLYSRSEIRHMTAEHAMRLVIEKARGEF